MNDTYDMTRFTTLQSVTVPYQPLPDYRGDNSAYLAGYLAGMADAQGLIERVLNSRDPIETARRIQIGLI